MLAAIHDPRVSIIFFVLLIAENAARVAFCLGDVGVAPGCPEIVHSEGRAAELLSRSAGLSKTLELISFGKGNLQITNSSCSLKNGGEKLISRLGIAYLSLC